MSELCMSRDQLLAVMREAHRIARSVSIHGDTVVITLPHGEGAAFLRRLQTDADQHHDNKVNNRWKKTRN